MIRTLQGGRTLRIGVVIDDSALIIAHCPRNRLLYRRPQASRIYRCPLAPTVLMDGQIIDFDALQSAFYNIAAHIQTPHTKTEVILGVPDRLCVSHDLELVGINNLSSAKTFVDTQAPRMFPMLKNPHLDLEVESIVDHKTWRVHVSAIDAPIIQERINLIEQLGWHVHAADLYSRARRRAQSVQNHPVVDWDGLPLQKLNDDASVHVALGLANYRDWGGTWQ
jgi:hypothetical protein